MHESWETALGEAPLSNLVSTATSILAGAAPAEGDPTTDPERYGAAKSRMEADIPEALRNQAFVRSTRLDTERSRAADSSVGSAALLARQLGATSGIEFSVAAASEAVDRSETALGEFVLRGQQTLDNALSLLAEALNAPELSEPDRTRISELETDAATDAIDLETAFFEADDQHASAVATRELQLLGDILGDDAGDDAISEDDINALATVRTAAEDALTAARAPMDEWEQAVPDDAWKALGSFLRADGALRVIADADAEALMTTLVDAEQALADSLEAAESARRAELTPVRRRRAVRGEKRTTQERPRRAVRKHHSRRRMRRAARDLDELKL